MSGWRARVARLPLEFAFMARTSRGSMTRKTAWLVELTSPDGVSGVGEAAPFPGLSAEWEGDADAYERLLAGHVGRFLATGALAADCPSSVRMGVESALAAVADAGTARPPFSLEINGLVWIDTREAMLAQARAKLAEGYRCVKVKVGSLDFDAELSLLRELRGLPGGSAVTLRLDANGAFAPADALERLRALAPLGIHSLEQPLPAGMTEATAELCRRSPVPIALDEELTGCACPEEMLRAVRPQYIVVKPTLHGGLSGAARWLALADRLGIGRWVTSALETNVGLHAIARFTQAHAPGALPQGLGTGQIYRRNIPGPVERRGRRVVELPDLPWQLPPLAWTTL